jgi:MOSC domain-containing protein YiiM
LIDEPFEIAVVRPHSHPPADDAPNQSMSSKMAGIVIAVSRSATHTLIKANRDSIFLSAGLGVEGDAHRGATVKHRSRVARDATAPNLRQVHLIHAELHDALRATGFAVTPGQMGENITTSGLDLLGLPTGTRLRLGATAIVELTGLRNPCAQLDKIQRGLMAATLDRDAAGNLVRKAGVMGVVAVSGEVRPGDSIRAEPPAPPYRSLAPV